MMGGGILNKLLSNLDNAAYKGVVGLSKYPNSIGMGRETLRQKAKSVGNDIDNVFTQQSFSPLMRNDKLKIRSTGGGGTPMLQELYEKLTKK